MTSNDQAWEIIFEELKLHTQLQQASCITITAKQINEIGQREARLMAKFDTQESLPKLFKKSQLNINATSNGSYVIFKDPSHKSFIPLPSYKDIVPVKFYPSLSYPLETLIFSAKMSESNAIDFAHHSKILSDYVNEESLLLTSRGRFFSGEFTFSLNQVEDIIVKGVQIEVDAGYEGEQQFLIIEAKSTTHNSFNIRQLYYPYRHFQNRINKKIRTILLSFSNGIYYITEIAFNNNYYDYTILNNVAYEVVVGQPKKRMSIAEMLDQPTHTPHGIPIIQANDINKVIDLLNFLNNNPSDKFIIANYFGVHERQGDYYPNAARFIGVVTKGKNRLFELTEVGKEILSITNREERNWRLIEEMLKVELINNLFKKRLNSGFVTNKEVSEILVQAGLGGTTPGRRSSTIKGWIDWMFENSK